MTNPEREERRPRRRAGAPVQEVSNNFEDDGTTTAWWSKPPHQITREELDAVSGRIGRAVGALEVAASMVVEVAAT